MEKEVESWEDMTQLKNSCLRAKQKKAECNDCFLFSLKVNTQQRT